MIGTSPSLNQIVQTDASWRDCENMFHNGEPDCGQKRYRMIDTAPKTSNLLSDFYTFQLRVNLKQILEELMFFISKGGCFSLHFFYYNLYFCIFTSKGIGHFFWADVRVQFGGLKESGVSAALVFLY